MFSFCLLQQYKFGKLPLFHPAMFIERITRIELASPAWEADALTIVLYSQFGE